MVRRHPLQSFAQQYAVTGGHSVAYTNYIARTSGLDTTHQNAYAGFLDGLTTDGLFNSDGSTNFFDVIQYYACQTQANGLLNMVSSSFAATVSGTLTFTADRGFTGNSSGGSWVDTGFNPSTASSPKYTQNSAHISAWSMVDLTVTDPLVYVASATTGENIYPKFTDNNVYLRVNDTPEAGGFAVTDSLGHYLGNRSSSTARQGYKNGASVGTYASVNSQAPLNTDFICVGSATPNSRQIGFFSAGASLSSGQVTSFYNRLRTCMTALGVP